MLKNKKFEVAIFNQEVRRMVKEDEHHREFTDDWEDLHYIEIEANDEREARARMEVRYPAAKGFVIDHVQEVHDDG